MAFTGKEHEEATVRSFIVPERQERLLAFLGRDRDRKKLIGELQRSGIIDVHFATQVPWKVDPSLKLWDRHRQGVENLVYVLKSKGAGPTCWALSSDRTLDRREVDLASAIETTTGGAHTTILSCLPGKLAYFIDEYESLLLER